MNTSSTSIWVIHSSPLLATGLARTLGSHFEVVVADAAASYCATPRGNVAVTDRQTGLKMSREQAFSSLEAARGWRCLIVDHQAGVSQVREALEEGVYGYVQADCPPEVLLQAVKTIELGQRFLCRASAASVAESIKRDRLTARETDVLRLLCAGMANKSIGRELNMALGTVKCHVKSILEKLGVHSRTQAVVTAHAQGLIDVNVDQLN